MSQRGRGTVLLTGGTGFIGSHVRRSLDERGIPVRLMARRPGGDGSAEVVYGDLADPVSLRGALDGVTTLVHAASAITQDREEARIINEVGTRALVAEARRAGVPRIVYVSTAAVYGPGIHRGIAEDAVTPAPESATSRSRLAAERAILAAEGTVLRPMFVYGTGDRWFVPGLARLARRVGGRPERGRGRLSVISVEALAEAVRAVVERPVDDLHGAVLHAAHPEEVTLGEILDVLAEHSIAPGVTGDLCYEQALTCWDDSPGRLALVSFDHFYDSSRLWKAVGPVHGARFREAFPRYAAWYRGSCLGG